LSTASSSLRPARFGSRDIDGDVDAFIFLWRLDLLAVGVVVVVV
jgi:hypothetical protein